MTESEGSTFTSWYTIPLCSFFHIDHTFGWKFKTLTDQVANSPPPLQLQISFASNMYFTLRSIETWCRKLLRPLLKEQKKKKNCILASQSDRAFYNSNAYNHKSVKAPWILFTYILVDLLSSVIHGNKIHIFTITITMLGGKIIISFISVDSVWLYCRIFPGIHNVSWIAATIGPALVWNIKKK